MAGEGATAQVRLEGELLAEDAAYLDAELRQEERIERIGDIDAEEENGINLNCLAIVDEETMDLERTLFQLFPFLPSEKLLHVGQEEKGGEDDAHNP